ncbi:hypothetical protein SAMN05428997_102234 [Bosea sp. CRIB-10]|nr:hypothetical protein SAMN05428997_102234 [Bosea sp. CRIB-10]
MVRSPRRLPCSGAAALLLSAIFMTMSLLLGLPATAQERAVALDKPRLAQAPEPYCYCWSDGKKIAEGSMACIRTTMGRRLATCGRVTNLMSWEVTENPCPES